MGNCFACSVDGCRRGSGGGGRLISLDSFDGFRAGSSGLTAGFGGKVGFRNVSVLDGSFVSPEFRGGRGGNSVSPHAGARSGYVPVSTDVARVSAVLAVPEVDDVENEVLDVVDSEDGLLCGPAGGRRGGKGGPGWLGVLRAGSGGGLDPLASAVFGLVLVMVGGGRLPFCLFPFDLLLTTEPSTSCGRLLMDLAVEAAGRGGRLCATGPEDAPFGTRPTCDCFRAAIRS